MPLDLRVTPIKLQWTFWPKLCYRCWLWQILTSLWASFTPWDCNSDLTPTRKHEFQPLTGYLLVILTCKLQLTAAYIDIFCFSPASLIICFSSFIHTSYSCQKVTVGLTGDSYFTISQPSVSYTAACNYQNWPDYLASIVTSVIRAFIIEISSAVLCPPSGSVCPWWMFIISIVLDLHPPSGGYNHSVYINNAFNSCLFFFFLSLLSETLRCT